MIRLLVAVVALLAQADPLAEADAAFRAGDFDRAARLARQVVAKQPDSAHAHMILGVIGAQGAQWTAATKHFTEVIRLAPQDPQGYFYLGQAHLYQRNWERAIGFFTQAQKRNYPDGERLAVELAYAQNEAGRPEAALAGLETIRPPAAGPLAIQYYSVVGLARGKLNQTAAALEAMRRARDLDDSRAESWEFIISTLMGTDMTPAALAEAIRAQRKFPDDPNIQFLFALTSYYVAESPLTPLALRHLREAEPGSARVLLVEGLLHRKRGRNEEAVAAFRQAAERGVPDARLLLGIVLKENGDYAAAEREYREAERLNPRNGQALLELGKLLLSNGDLEGALPRLEKSAEYMPASSAVHYQLGLLYGRLGRKQKAEEHMGLWRKLEAAAAAQNPRQ